MRTMLPKLKKYFQESRRRYGMLKEARAILKALGQPAGTGPDLQVLTILMNIGLGHLRAVKAQRDVARAALEMDLRIKEGPRPSYAEASLN